MSELMFENRWEHFVTLFIDLIIFFVHSIFNICETIFLSILPEKYRKLKVCTILLLYKISIYCYHIIFIYIRNGSRYDGSNIVCVLIVSAEKCSVLFIILYY